MFNLRELDLAKLPKVARPLYADNLQRYGHQLLESLRELVLGKEYDKAASCVSLLLTQFHAYSAACLRVCNNYKEIRINKFTDLITNIRYPLRSSHQPL